MNLIKDINKTKEKRTNASLTVEASLVLPLFLFFFMCFLYFIQIITLQEVLQEALTETGLSMARTAYIYSDFNDGKEMEGLDPSLLEEGVRVGLDEIKGAIINNVALNHAVKSRINIDMLDKSCVSGGFDGINFDKSKILEGDDNIDIVATYQVKIPIKIFGLYKMNMIQRVKLRSWMGHQLPALYTMVDEENNEEEDPIVYITESGSVYHLDRNCSHISLSIQAIGEIPSWQRNESGGKYYPCESCCKNDIPSATYYISLYGDRYHIDRGCSRIKRTVKPIPLSEVGDRAACKRCGK